MSILQKSPKLARIVSTGQKWEELSGGHEVAEGPVWHQERGVLTFSDIRPSLRMQWSPERGVSQVAHSTEGGNGATLDPQGRLLICHMGARRVTRTEADGSITVVADRYHGMRLNRPNDVVVKSDGAIYFTDSDAAANVYSEIDFSGVYRVSPDLSTINMVVRDCVSPNGLAFSPDEKTLYVDDTRRGHIRAFDVNPNGIPNLASDRVFAELKSGEPGWVDGMKVDVEGNVYCTGPGGVWIFNPTGEHLGSIVVGGEPTTNVGWGGGDWQTLFITTMKRLLRIRLNIPGIAVPRKL